MMWDKIWNWCLTNWGVLVFVLPALFFLYKIRVEENLKTKLKFILDAYVVLADLNSSIQHWAIPISFDDVDKDEELNKVLKTTGKEAMKAFHRASVLLHPKTVGKVDELNYYINETLRSYSNWKMHVSQYQRDQERFTNESRITEMTNEYEKHRKEFPKKLNETLCAIRADFQIMTNGFLTIFWWKISGWTLIPLSRRWFRYEIDCEERIKIKQQKLKEQSNLCWYERCKTFFKKRKHQ